MKKGMLRSQIERFTYDKRILNRNVLQWKRSMEEVKKVLEGGKRDKGTGPK